MSNWEQNLGGHDIGQSCCLFSRDASQCLIYVNIPKNASSWAKHHMPGWSFNFLSKQFDTRSNGRRVPQWSDNCQVQYMVILRDPVDRWITGLAQYLRGWDPAHPMHIDNLDWDYVIEKIMFDSHTQPQIEFIQGIDFDRTHWLCCDSNLYRNFAAVLEKFTGNPVSLTLPDQDAENIFNVTSKVQPTVTPRYTTARQQYIVDCINHKLQQRPDYVMRVRNFYQQDIELYNSVEFTNWQYSNRFR